MFQQKKLVTVTQDVPLSFMSDAQRRPHPVSEADHCWKIVMSAGRAGREKCLRAWEGSGGMRRHGGGPSVRRRCPVAFMREVQRGTGKEARTGRGIKKVADFPESQPPERTSDVKVSDHEPRRSMRCAMFLPRFLMLSMPSSSFFTSPGIFP